MLIRLYANAGISLRRINVLPRPAWASGSHAPIVDSPIMNPSDIRNKMIIFFLLASLGVKTVFGSTVITAPTPNL